jgi:hypothetical protein
MLFDGSKINHSIIGCRTRIEEGMTISHLVIGAATETRQEMVENRSRGFLTLGRNSSVANAIIDRDVRVGNDVVIKNAGEHCNSTRSPITFATTRRDSERRHHSEWDCHLTICRNLFRNITRVDWKRSVWFRIAERSHCWWKSCCPLRPNLVQKVSRLTTV